MAITKEELFSTSRKRVAELMKALSHPARIAIVELLIDRKNCFCGDITEELPLAQSTVSQHLKALKEAGIISGEIEGVKTCYCLDEEGLQTLNKLIEPFLQQILKSTKDNCC